MNDKIKNAFDNVHAETVLKENTKTFIMQRIQKTKNHNRMNHLIFAPVAAMCLLFILIGGHWLYFIPTAKISIDINPSIELGINRFDKVITINGYNDDGRDLVSSLDIKYMNYSEAVDTVLKDEHITALLLNDEVMEISVIGSKGKQCTRILSNLETCAEKHDNTYCYFADSHEVDAAHDAGLSFGKYRAFLELQLLDPSITAEEIHDMTMREIRDMINALSGNSDSNNNSGHHNEGYGHERENHKGQ